MTTEADVTSLTYEAALGELDTLITRLERGDVNLDDAIRCYERGSQLAQRCAELLDRTEAAVTQLVVGARGRVEERPFSPQAAAEPFAAVAVPDEAPAAAPALRALPSRGGGRGAAERPVAPPPPGAPLRARTAAEPQPAPAGLDPGLFPGLGPAGGVRAEDDFGLDEIPF